MLNHQMKNLRSILKLSNRGFSNHNFESDPILPVYWRTEGILDPSSYIIDTTNENLLDGPEKNQVLAKRMLATFEQVGLVLLRGNRPIADHLDVMSEWAKVCFPNLAKYEGGANSRNTIIENVYDAGVPKEASLHYHHEMDYLSESIRGLGFCAYKAIEDPNDPLRGATFLSDNVGATNDLLSTATGQKLKEKGMCCIRNMTNKNNYKDMDGVYNHWQRYLPRRYN